MRLSDLIVRSAEAILPEQRRDGSFPPGHNGPYRDPETPVRNTCHWLITLLKALELSGDGRFKDAAERAAAYLTSQEARPMNATFWCRKNPEKDFCNGLIGQAWAIEALALAAEKMSGPGLKELAEEVLLLHPFDEKIGLWQRVNVDGSYSSFDRTFNHQLWFAAAGSLLLGGQSGQVKSRVARFMDRLPQRLSVRRTGLIRHSIEAGVVAQGLYRYPARLLTMASRVERLKPSQPARIKEIGYHSFNLYAFALLKEQLPRHSFWETGKFKAALQYVTRAELAGGLEDNRYGYPYNPPGIELAYALHVFSSFYRADAALLISNWVSEQVRRCYDFDTGLMTGNTEDPVTQAARIYEATRLPDIEVQVG